MFDKIGFLLGYIKLYIYKIAYGNKLKFTKRIRFMPSSKIRIEGNGSLVLGDNFRSRYNVLIKVEDGASIKIGDNVFINDNSCIVSKEGITIGSDTLIGNGVQIYDHDHIFGTDVKVSDSGFYVKKISIGTNVWLGLNSVILAGAKINDNVVVAAGTLIKREIFTNRLVLDKKEKIEKELK